MIDRFKKIHISSAFCAASLVLFGFVAFANTLPNQMFWDDNDFILNNQYVKDWHYFPQMFSQNIIAGSGLHSNYWRPVLLTVFALEWHAWQTYAPLYHAINLIFHILNGLLLFFILYRLFRNKFLAFFTALVFLIHPVQAEAVSYANSLGDSLSVFFMFSGLWLFLQALKDTTKKYYKNWRYYLALLMYPLALMSKETAIIMPAFLGLIWLFFQDNAVLFKNATKLWKNINKIIYGLFKVLALFLLIAGIYLVLRTTVLNFGGTFNLYQQSNAFSSSVIVRILTFFKILSVYLGLLFWPQHLHMERSLPWAASLAHVDVIVGFIIFAAILALAVWQFRKKSPLSFGLFWFLIALAPTSNIAVPINGLLYEHWLYVPLVGMFLACFYIIFELQKKLEEQKSIMILALWAAVVFALAGFLLRTISRNFEWRDPITFYRQTLEYSPGSYRIVNNLAMEYAARHENAEAESYYKRAIQIDPPLAVAHYNLGNLYVYEARLKEAQNEYEISLQNDPKFFYAYGPLIQIYVSQGKKDQAKVLYNQYINYSQAN